MLKLRDSLVKSSTLGWSASDPCQWSHVGCTDNRVDRIQIGHQNLQGTLPPELRNLTQLTRFEVMSNNLTGPLPSLSGLSSLQVLLLHTNSFSSIPPDFFTGMTSLTSVSLDANPFESWEIPESLKDATSLKEFSANDANVAGKIPEFFNDDVFSGLESLHLAFNYLEGEFPLNFSGSAMRSLWLNSQKSNSRLNGTVSVLQNMTSLTEIWLHGNSFTGPLPDFSGMISLEDLSLRDNSLTGVVPPSLGNISTLRVVNFTNNKLQGPTPKFADRVSVDMIPGTNNFCFDKPGVACDATVNVLLSVAENFGYPASLADSWKGNDPCSSDTWKGIACAGKDILVINLKKAGLTGTISSDFSLISTLQELFLSDNMLTVEYAGNPDIGKNGSIYPPPGTPGITPGSPSGTGGDSDGSGNKNLATGKIVGSVIGVVCGLCLAGLGLFFYNRKQKRSSKVQSPNMMIIHPRHSGDQAAVKITAAESIANIGAQSFTDSVGTSDIHVVRTENMVISIQVLRNVTNNFSEENILGRGGFGTVYKGELHDGTKIAVKRMESGVVSEKGLAEFMSEIAMSFQMSCFTTQPNPDPMHVMTCSTFGSEGKHLMRPSLRTACILLLGSAGCTSTRKHSVRQLIPTINLDEETLGSISTVAELAGHCTAREPYQRPDMGHVVNVLSSLIEIWKPAEPDSDDMYGIDFETPLPEVLLKWQAFDGSSSSFPPSGDNTQTSIPTRPSGFAESFTSADGR
ncbi:hypothetical protein OIU85_005877 [Salix viminalis]|uniref:Leucine-rich repeat-containing N-terminal plant-type domain-containing protein n=1 Tax=Salix viminalis TaxID=40686 RepID=A0A9Q0PK68_SALVM|nr:hypothetical protein OIU85_005877 [Salix viminalis]